MPGFKPIDPNIKAEIITKIRDEGMRVVDADTLLIPCPSFSALILDIHPKLCPVPDSP